MRELGRVRQRAEWFAVLATCAVLLSASAQAGDVDSTGAETCSLQPGPTRTVTRVIDGETLALDDGSEVRLIGALAPRASDANAAAGAWPLEEAAKTSLAELTLGKRVELAFGGQRTDRYGRHVAHLFINEGGQRLWVQGEMLQLGLARAYALPGNDACIAELMANEAVARTAEAGLWPSHIYSPRPADKTFLLMGLRSTFQIVRGKVASVKRTKSAVYLDFGSDWHTDFTVSIGKRVLGLDDKFSARLEALAGKTIEVRGWIERRNGPAIAITNPAEIKIIGEEAPADAPVALVPRQGEPLTAPAAERDDGPPPQPAQKQNRPKRKAPGDVDL